MVELRALCTGLGALEGPTTLADGSLVVVSIDQGKVYRVVDGEAQVLATAGGGPNGATEGPNGTIYVAQNGGAHPALNKVRSAPGVQVIERTGELRRFGDSMRSPNDLCFGPDGHLYVTDPTRKPERDDGRIWRCDVRTGKCELLVLCNWYPNGIGFSEEQHCIYVADSKNRRIVRLPLSNPAPENVETVIQIDHGIPDGFAFDSDGNVVVACPNLDPNGGDVQVYRRGKLIDVVRPGKSKLYTNVAISQNCDIYICDAELGEVHVGRWPCPGLPLHPFRNVMSDRSKMAQVS